MFFLYKLPRLEYFILVMEKRFRGLHDYPVSSATLARCALVNHAAQSILPSLPFSSTFHGEYYWVLPGNGILQEETQNPYSGWHLFFKLNAIVAFMICQQGLWSIQGQCLPACDCFSWDIISVDTPHGYQ